MSKRLKRKAAYTRGPGVVPVRPLTDTQARYINAIHEGPVVICTGYAGTGKTFIAAKIAAQLFAEKTIDKIILTRPNISAGPSLGCYPGGPDDKMDPWMQPLSSRLKADLGGAYDSARRNGSIRVEPFETMRGASFDGFVILDEAQNTTPPEMKMFLSRYEGGRLIINGDIRQSDLKGDSGLSVVVDMIKAGELSFHHIDFSDVDDIVRSDVCREVILAWDKYENG